MIDVSPYQLEIIKKALKKYVTECEVRVFGSRATWTAKDYSDLDLAVVGKNKLSDKVLFALKEDFQESDLPFRVDVLDWHAISKEFQTVISRNYEVLQKSKTKFKETKTGLPAPSGMQGLPTPSGMQGLPAPKTKLRQAGKIPEDWEVKRVKDACFLFRESYTPSKEDHKRYIGLEHIEQNTLKLNGVGSSNDMQSNKLIFKKGQILFGKLRPYFRKVYRPDFDGVCSTDIFVIDGKQGFDNGFLFYMFADNCMVEEATLSSEGTRMLRASWNYLESLKKAFPEIEEQKAIAKILSALDSKIELNNQMNKTLEAIGQALFKRWFIDFESIRSSDWRVDELGKHVEFIKGKKPDKISEVYLAGYRPQILIENLNGKDSLYANKDGMTVVGIDEPIIVMDGASSGRVEIGHDGILGSTLAKVIATNDLISNLFLYYFLKSKESEINQNTTGTSIPHADKERIKKFQCVLPSRGSLKSFNKIALIILNKIIVNKKEIKTLSQIRDSLLPRLMSGRIRVDEFGEVTE